MAVAPSTRKAWARGHPVSSAIRWSAQATTLSGCDASLAAEATAPRRWTTSSCGARTPRAVRPTPPLPSPARLPPDAAGMSSQSAWRAAPFRYAGPCPGARPETRGREPEPVNRKNGTRSDPCREAVPCLALVPAVGHAMSHGFIDGKEADVVVGTAHPVHHPLARDYPAGTGDGVAGRGSSRKGIDPVPAPAPALEVPMDLAESSGFRPLRRRCRPPEAAACQLPAGAARDYRVPHRC